MKVLALPLYGIGDVLMTTPALKNLHEALGAEVTYLHMFKTTRDILAGNPHIVENTHFPFLESSRLEGLRFLSGYRKKFDVSINFYPSNRRDYTLSSWFSGSPLRVGHRYRNFDLRELNFLKNRTIKEDEELHCVEENLELLKLLGLKSPQSGKMEIYLTNEETGEARAWRADNRIEGKTLIGMHPGTSVFKNHDRRRWPLESFAALIDKICAASPETVFVLFGGPEERPLKNQLQNLVADPAYVLSAETAGIRPCAALIGLMQAFVTNDSGLMHIAAAMKVPVTAVFGPTNPMWVRPWGVEHRVVRLGLPCSPCFCYTPVPLHCPAGLDFECLREVPVKNVYDALMEILRKDAPDV